MGKNLYYLLKLNFTLFIFVICLFFNSQITNFFIGEPSLPLQEKLFQDKITLLHSNQSVKKNEVLTVAESFIGVPYKSTGLLEISLDSVNSLSLVDQVICLVLTNRTKEKSYVTFEYFLNKVNYLDGGDKIYYFLQWKDNLEKRGVLSDVTPVFSTAVQTKKQLNAYSKHDSQNVRLKQIEKHFSKQPLTYIPFSAVQQIESQLHDGDIIAILSKDKNKELSNIGIVKIIDKKPHLIYTENNGNTIVSNICNAGFFSENDLGIIVLQVL